MQIVAHWNRIKFERMRADLIALIVTIIYYSSILNRIETLTV